MYTTLNNFIKLHAHLTVFFLTVASDRLREEQRASGAESRRHLHRGSSTLTLPRLLQLHQIPPPPAHSRLSLSLHFHPAEAHLADVESSFDTVLVAHVSSHVLCGYAPAALGDNQVPSMPLARPPNRYCWTLPTKLNPSSPMPSGKIWIIPQGGFRHSGGGLDENRLKRCRKSVIRGEWWISAMRGGVGFFLVSEGCVTAQTFVEIEENSFPLFFFCASGRKLVATG